MSNKGVVYALINPGMPGYVKIGKTKRDVEKRVNELSSSTGVPHTIINVLLMFFSSFLVLKFFIWWS